MHEPYYEDIKKIFEFLSDQLFSLHPKKANFDVVQLESAQDLFLLLNVINLFTVNAVNFFLELLLIGI